MACIGERRPILVTDAAVSEEEEERPFLEGGKGGLIGSLFFPSLPFSPPSRFTFLILSRR